MKTELIIANSEDKSATFVYTIIKDKVKYLSEENSEIKAVFDADNHFINSVYSRDGLIDNKVKVKPQVLTNTNTEFGKEGWATPADVPCGQTMFNGFIVYDMETGQVLGFIIVSEVHGLCPPSTENGGGGSDPAAPPIIDCSNALAFVNSI
jgi:hypothetical protein